VITSKSRYGLLFLIDLVDNGGSGPLDLSGIAAREGIPEAYLAKLVAPLKASGILSSSRGSKGGYELAKPPSSVSLLELVEALEGRSGSLGLTAADGQGEPGEGPAAERARAVWHALDKAVCRELSGTSLEAVAAARGIEYHI
jgi:Rrf2 family protein